jgi:uncharacterized protein YcbK (DUF882 family)
MGSEADWVRWPHFTEAEMRCKGTGRCLMDPAFMDCLEALRQAFAKPMTIASGYRAPEYNARVSGTGLDGPHTTGRAVDVAVAGADALRLVGLAVAHGFTGIGVCQKGGARFIHLDDITPGGRHPRPTLWSY